MSYIQNYWEDTLRVQNFSPFTMKTLMWNTWLKFQYKEHGIVHTGQLLHIPKIYAHFYANTINMGSGRTFFLAVKELGNKKIKLFPESHTTHTTVCCKRIAYSWFIFIWSQMFSKWSCISETFLRQGIILLSKPSQPTGFEPVRAEPNRFLVYRLNHWTIDTEMNMWCNLS